MRSSFGESALRILQIIGTLNPQYGGPVEAAKQLAFEIGRCGHSIQMLTLDAPSASWLEDREIRSSACALGPSYGKYRYAPRLVPWLKKNLESFDVVIVHGIWQYQSRAVHSVCRAKGVPYCVFVHGALDPWFRKTYPLKQLKKWLYWPWAEYRSLRDAGAVLFTCEEERVLARQSFWLYRVKERVVAYGIGRPREEPSSARAAFLSKFPQLANRRFLLFMSRLHRKKGLDLLIEAFRTLSDRHPSVHLVVAGPDQEGLRSELSRFEGYAAIEQRVHWLGMLTGEVRWGAYHAADAFCLPSHSENFGLVVAEALARRLPVLISNKVNIWREIESAGAGLIAQDTLDGTRNLLVNWLNMSSVNQEGVRARTQPCFEQNFEIQQSSQRLLSVLEEVVAESGRGGFTS